MDFIERIILWLRRLFSPITPSLPLSAPIAPAAAPTIMMQLNSHALCGFEGATFVAIEDVEIEDRWFRIEYRCDSLGRNASAKVIHNPLGNNDGYSVHQKHLHANQQICLGSGTYDLATVVSRSRYWCLGYCHLRQHGSFPNP